MQRGVRDLVVHDLPALAGRRDQVLLHLGLPVDPHRAAGEVDEVEVVPLAVPTVVPLQVDAAVLVALALEPVGQPDLAQQVDGRLLEDAGADPGGDVLLRPGLDHHRLDALAVEQVGEQHPGRPGPDDRDLGALLRHGSSTPSAGGPGRGPLLLNGSLGRGDPSHGDGPRSGPAPRWLGGRVEQLPTTWRAQWVSPTAEPTPAGRRPAYRLRGELRARAAGAPRDARSRRRTGSTRPS